MSGSIPEPQPASEWALIIQRNGIDMATEQKADPNKIAEDLNELLSGIDEQLSEAAVLAGKLARCFEDGDPDKIQAQRWQIGLLQNPVGRILEEMDSDEGATDMAILLMLAPDKLKALINAATAATSIIPNEIAKLGSSPADAIIAIDEAKASLPQ